MKFTRCLSVVAVVSCLSANSVAAIAKTPESENPTISAAKTEPILIANPFGILNSVIQTIDGVGEAVDRHNRRQEETRQRQELEEARRRASEQERLEAERRQRYFESLSPQEQKAYMEEQRALQAQRDTAALLFMMTLFSVGTSGASGVEGSPNDICYVYNSDGTPAYSTTRDQISNFSGVECRAR